MNIDLACEDDLVEILKLQKDCYQEEAAIYDDYNIPPLTQTLESIHADFKMETFLKVTANDKIIGSVRGYIENQTCKIGRLIVHRDFRNRGLGKTLMRALEDELKEAKRFELFTGNKSERNLRLYNNLGYHEIKRKSVNDKLELVFLEKINDSKTKL
ncbi:MAG: GNAT family N-acetyltransferase [Cyclobacteriaceae bacterium]